jgi:hypothetical protein
VKTFTTSKILFYLGIPLIRIGFFLLILSLFYIQSEALPAVTGKTVNLLGLTISLQEKILIDNIVFFGVTFLCFFIIILAILLKLTSVIEVNDSGIIAIRYPITNKKNQIYEAKKCMGYKIIQIHPLIHSIELLSEYGKVPLFPYIFGQKKFTNFIQTLQEKNHLVDYTNGVSPEILKKMETGAMKNPSEIGTENLPDTIQRLQKNKSGITKFMIILIGIIILLLILGFGIATLMWNTRST